MLHFLMLCFTLAATLLDNELFIAIHQFYIMLFYLFAILDLVTQLSSNFTLAKSQHCTSATHRPVTLLASSLTGQIRTTKGDTSIQLSLDRYVNLIPQGMSPSDGCRRDIERVSSLITALCTITSDPLTHNLNNSVCLGLCI